MMQLVWIIQSYDDFKLTMWSQKGIFWTFIQKLRGVYDQSKPAGDRMLQTADRLSWPATYPKAILDVQNAEF